MRPRVVVHSAASVDGRLDGFPVDVGLYYELADRIPHQAVLSGSGTILAAAAREGVDMADEVEEPAGRGFASDPAAPWLVVVDSRAQVTRFDWLRSSPFWRHVLVLCAAATPVEHRALLRSAGVPHEVVGELRVDLAAALDVLAERYGVQTVRVDAGPSLISALLAAGLVDELSLLVSPHLVGEGGEPSLRLLAGDVAARLTLTSLERLRDDHVWLRYAARAEP